MIKGITTSSTNLCKKESVAGTGYNTRLESDDLFIASIKALSPATYTFSWQYSSDGSGGVTNQIRLRRSDKSEIVRIENGASFTLSAQDISDVADALFYFGNTCTSGSYSSLMLNAGSSPLPYEPYQVAHDITRIPMRGKNLFDPNSDTTNDAGLPRPGVTVPSGVYSIDNTTARAVYYRIGANGTTSQINGGRSVENIAANDDLYVWRDNNNREDGVMLNLGNQALPYEPYGIQPGWEVRDQQGTILWAADKTLTGTDSIPMKGYGLPLTDYKVEADMTVPATQEYSIEGTSSIDYQSDGTALTDLEFQGNMVQSGTPSSSSPIYPSEMGERTGNLFNKATVTHGYYVNDTTGVIATNPTYAEEANASDYIPVSGDYVYVYSDPAGKWRWAAFYDSNKTYVSGFSGYNKAIAIPANAAYMRLTVVDGILDTLMINLGSTALPYEPYGYKIPFSNGQTSYNVYLTEPLRKIGDYADKVESDGTVTRRVRKFVVTSDKISSFNAGLHRIGVGVYASVSSDAAICSHYIVKVKSDGTFEHMYIGSNNQYIFIFDPSFETQADAVNFLDAQYAAGTPVTVWYVLATETTEQVTFPTVTTAQGANTLSVSTTLAPSKTRLTATSGVWPKNPIWPVEFGEKTVNLLNPVFEQGGLASADGTTTVSAGRIRTVNYTNLSQGTYSITVHPTTWVCVFVYDTDGTYKQSESYLTWSQNGTTFSITGDRKVKFIFANTNRDAAYPIADFDTNIMLNSGQTPLPYEPYNQYKIPITCGGNTYNVFTTAPLRKIGPHADYEQLSVGEGRKIDQYALTGSENIWSNGVNRDYKVIQLVFASPYSGTTVPTNVICTHLETAPSASSTSTSQSIAMRANGINIIFGLAFDTISASDSDSDNAILAKAISYISSEYAAGRPVTIWYVLATEQTTPTQLPTITPTDGNDTFAVNTTVPPSAVTITGHVKARTT